MPQPVATGRLLSSRDRFILEHVARHRLTIHQAVHRLYFAGQGPNAAAKAIGRLWATGYLRKFRWLRQRSYFVLGPAAVRLLGVSSKRTTPLGNQALPTELAVLFFATLGQKPRLRLTPAELKDSYPWMPRPLARLPHCLDTTRSQSPCLELVRVDLGAEADHVARKCRRDIQLRRDIPEFRELLRHRRFRLVVVTATAQKAAALQEALDQHSWPEDLVIHLAAARPLFSFLGSFSHAS